MISRSYVCKFVRMTVYNGQDGPTVWLIIAISSEPCFSTALAVETNHAASVSKRIERLRANLSSVRSAVVDSEQSDAHK